MKETCCSLECQSGATLQIDDPLAPNEPSYACDDHLAEFIPDGVTMAVTRLIEEERKPEEVKMVSADVTHPTCACGQIFGMDWTLKDAVIHQEQQGHRGHLILMPFHQKGGKR